MLNELIEAYPDEKFLIATGFDDAILGIDGKTLRIIYSVERCIKILMEQENWNYEEAEEFFEYNTVSAYVGEKTPIWCYNFK